MKIRLISWALSAGLIGSIFPLTAAPPVLARAETDTQDTSCEDGLSDSGSPPPGPAGPNTPRCETGPTSTTEGSGTHAFGENDPDGDGVAEGESEGGSDDTGPADGESEEEEIQPNGPITGSSGGHHWLGARTNWGQFTTTGIYAALNVTDPAVRRSSGQYMSQRILATTCHNQHYIEVGWTEVGWRDDAQYIYTYSSRDNQWRFYDQFPIQKGDRFYVELYREWYNSPVDWIAQLWWNGQWHALDRMPIPPGQAGAPDPSFDCGENMVEVQAQGDRHFPFDPVQFGDGTGSGVQIETHPQGSFRTWDTSIPTTSHTTADSSFFTAEWFLNKSYWSGQVLSHNDPPQMQMSVSPTRGSVATTYTGSISASDPDGDPITYSIDWGDGTVTPVPSGSHKYSAPGSYRVEGVARDPWTSSSASQTIEVCVVDLVGQCLTGSEAPRLCGGGGQECPETPEILEPCTLDLCLPAPAIPEPLDGLVDDVTEEGPALPVTVDPAWVTPADRALEQVSPQTTSREQCGSPGNFHVGTGQPEGNNVRAVKANITARRPKLCENDNNEHNASLVWSMLTNGGWAQSGYIRATERSGVRFFSQALNCLPESDSCDPELETKITPIPGVDIDTFVHGATHSYKQAYSDSRDVIKMMVDDIVLDETNFDPKKTWGEPWIPEWYGETLRRGTNVPGTKQNPVYFQNLKLRRGCDDCGWVTPSSQALQSSLNRYRAEWDNENHKFHIWTEN